MNVDGDNPRTVLCSSPPLTWNVCSKMVYMILPMPKEGSITFGTTSSTVTQRQRDGWVIEVFLSLSQHELHHVTHDKSHRAASSGIASRWPCPLWVWTSFLLSRWWTLCGVTRREVLDMKHPPPLSYPAWMYPYDVSSTHPVSLSSASCFVMKHSSHPDRYSVASLASFLYAFPIAPLLGSNWTTFTTLCGEIKEYDCQITGYDITANAFGVWWIKGHILQFWSCKHERIWVLLVASQRPEGPS